MEALSLLFSFPFLPILCAALAFVLSLVAFRAVRLFVGRLITYSSAFVITYLTARIAANWYLWGIAAPETMTLVMREVGQGKVMVVIVILITILIGTILTLEHQD